MDRTPLPDDLLEQHHVRVRGDDPLQQRMRLLQSQWRASRRLPMGERDGRPDGASLEPDVARRSLATFVHEDIAATWRRLAADPATAAAFNDPSVLTDLLSPRALTLNLFGAFGDDPQAFQQLIRGIVLPIEEVVVSAWFGGPCASDGRRAFDLHAELRRSNGATRLVCVDVALLEPFEVSTDPPSSYEDDLAEEMGCFVADRSALRQEPLLSLWRAHLRVGAVLRRQRSYTSTDYVLLCNTPLDDRLVDAYRRHLTRGSGFRARAFSKLIRREIRERRPELALALDDRYLAYDWVTPRGDAPPPRCPACRRRRNLPLLFGRPTAEAELAALRGEIILGGCTPWSENRECVACEHRWKSRARSTARRRAAAAKADPADE